MNDRPADDRLANGLLAEEARDRGGYSGSEELLQKLVDHELAAERRLRRAAITAWGVLLLLLLLFGVSMVTGSAWGRAWKWVAAGIYFGVPVLALLALIIAILTTAAWLFRPRGASLAIIERRLAALEDLLRRGG